LGPAPGPRPAAQLSGALMPPAALAANPVPAGPTLREDVLAGLSARPRRLPSKYFYDARGSALFEAITRQPEYYLTRVELALLATHMPGIAAAVGAGVHVVEYGSGSGLKTERLLAGLRAPLAYTPVEISPAALEACVARLRPRFPGVAMLPLQADFTRPLRLPPPPRAPAPWGSSPRRPWAASSRPRRCGCWLRRARPSAATGARWWASTWSRTRRWSRPRTTTPPGSPPSSPSTCWCGSTASWPRTSTCPASPMTRATSRSASASRPAW